MERPFVTGEQNRDLAGIKTIVGNCAERFKISLAFRNLIS
jgi:hypothetical protein